MQQSLSLGVQSVEQQEEKPDNQYSLNLAYGCKNG